MCLRILNLGLKGDEKMLYLGILWKLIFLLIVIILIIIKLKSHRNVELAIIHFGFFFYLLHLLEIVFFPLKLDSQILDYEFELNLIPFNTIIEMYKYGIKVFIKQVIGNIIIFVPLGFFIPIIYKKFNSFFSILFLGIICSITIELVQGIINNLTQFYNKVVDIDDVILNVLGVIVGHFTLTFCRKVFAKFFPTIKWLNLIKNDVN